MTERSQQELFRVASQIIYWGLLGLVCAALISSGVITPKTQVNGVVSCFIEERLNGWVIGGDLILQVFIVGLAALFLRPGSFDFIRDEICRSFYALGAFSASLVMVLHVYFAKFAPNKSGSLLGDIGMALLLLVVPVVFGFLLYVQGRKQAASQSVGH